MESIQIDQMSTDVKSDRATVKQLPTQKEVQTWIVNYVAELLEVNPNRIDVTIPFDRYGLDSSAAVGLAGDLEDWLERELDPTLLYDYPTIKTLSQHIVESLSD
ncbi:MAG: acyl carrier protein [Xenococcaceae cyanobacterium]